MSGDSERSELGVEFLLVNGKRKRFNFSRDATWEDAKLRLWKNYPAEFKDNASDAPPNMSALKLLYRGHYLPDDKLISSTDGIEMLDHIVVHLVVNKLDELNEEQDLKKPLRSSCCCVIS
ncbi:hypothetical protein BT69DRAFT_1291502 [Atractiella rhizophila]|nr:hypothetical protein BT69DRAFT_1291502 [Atractiella rhizophila]